jgi:RNA polymerase subunit RPABC4/transcription elongation factor Spt4
MSTPTVCPYCSVQAVYEKKDKADGGLKGQVWVTIRYCTNCHRVVS